MITSNCSSATFTSVQTGNWNVSTTWGNVGAAVCHVTIPCMTDSLNGGDIVLLGNLTHTVTCPTSITCSAGDSPSSDTGDIAIGAVSYSANASLIINGHLIVAGPVRMPNGTWSNSGGMIIIDSSWSSAPTTAAYSWSTNNVGNASTGGIFNNNSLFQGAGNSASNSACNNNACRSGPLGVTNAQLPYGFNDSGNINCNGGEFQYIGQTANGDVSIVSNLNAATRSFISCTFDSLQTIVFVESTRSANFTWSASQITNPLNTNSSSQGTVEWASAGTPSAACTWQNGDIFGPVYIDIVGTSTTYTNCTWTNMVMEAGPGGSQGWSTTNYGTGNSDQILYYIQFPGGDSVGTTLANGLQKRSVVATYVNPNQNSGQNDMHPVSVVQGNAGNILQDWFIEGNNFGAVSSMLEPQFGPSTNQTLEIENIVQPCNQAGIAIGDAININGNDLNNSHISIDNLTVCGNGVNPATDTHAMGIGGESTTFYAGTVPHIYSSLFYSDSNTNGPTEALCGGSGATFVAGTITTMSYNAYYYTAGTNPGPYCTIGIANYVTTFSNNTVIAANRGPHWLSPYNRILGFDQYLGYPLSGIVWTSGTTYTTGQIVSDSQSGVFGSNQFNWTFINKSGCTALASSANRPLTGTAWSQCWEPHGITEIRSLAVAGNIYNFPLTGATNLGVVGLLNAWEMYGYTPVGEGSTIASGGFGGTYIGAVQPLNSVGNIGGLLVPFAPF